jgi:hypothetical protein
MKAKWRLAQINTSSEWYRQIREALTIIDQVRVLETIC